MAPGLAATDVAPRFSVPPLDRTLGPALREKIDQKTKPIGALGRLEWLALQIGLIQNRLDPMLRAPAIVVFAGDHGITAEGVSAYPQEVTRQMVLNFLAGGAAVNVFARTHGLSLSVVDAGVGGDLSGRTGLRDEKIAPGTRNFVREPAMSPGEYARALRAGATVVDELADAGTNVIGFGEMGIGNTASAAMLMALILGLPLERCVGAGAGLDQAGVRQKLAVLHAADQRIAGVLPGAADVATDRPRRGAAIMQQCGGFEIAMISGAALRAAERAVLVLVDGFIASAALLAAREIDPRVLEYCVFTHRSDERGHAAMLKGLGAAPLLDLGLRLGEGTGAALAYPLVRSAVDFLNDMASFASAGVSDREPRV